ncbi:PglL family O-oligosaccharyltransferase [Psychrobacter sp. UBA5136]|uniref:PglL family O-oligosaccharyltransferase n=1 Tax=Psychrobacter sp. UBA5136 TaxID=1947356 RepID=UPI0025EBC366|nr:Wzy polymerase domain-containing protein [Psychrobacter sp. UBA5136]
MAIISKERAFTLEKLKSIKSLDIAYIFLILTLILPFFLFKRAAPQAAFYSELTGVICIAMFLLFACFGIKHFLIFNRLTLYLTAIASYLIVDIFINEPVYPSVQLLYIGSLLLSGLVSIIISSLCYEQGYKKILTMVCYGLMIGAVSQDIVVILQTLHQDWTGGWINYIKPGQAYSGNIGQRNLLAHYLSWGILASAYLVHQKKLVNVTGWTVIIFQAAILGAVNSKTLILYMLVILTLLIIAKLWQKQLPQSIIKTMAITVALVFIFQAITLPIISSLQDNLAINISSIERLTNNPEYNSRLTEWHKAWLIFLENPWFGSGWGSYTYQGFMISLDPRFAGNMSGSGIFTHSHNIVLNLLAETGIVGTGVILGGFAYFLKPLSSRSWQVETVVVLAMVIVTAIHSLLEFPLWYAHFFLVFVILLSILLTTSHSNLPLTKANKINNDKIKRYSIKAMIVICSFCYLLVAVQLYFLYWQMQSYQHGLDNSEQQRMITAKKIIDIGKQQPLMSFYSDVQALRGIIGISADKLPNEFDSSLYKTAHYWPDKITSFYYLMTQCDAKGAWNASDWLYYKQLNNYYPDNVDTYSILLSMTTGCTQVSDVIYRQCKENKNKSNVTSVCALESSKVALEE